MRVLYHVSILVLCAIFSATVFCSSTNGRRKSCKRQCANKKIKALKRKCVKSCLGMFQKVSPHPTEIPTSSSPNMSLTTPEYSLYDDSDWILYSDSNSPFIDISNQSMTTTCPDFCGDEDYNMDGPWPGDVHSVQINCVINSTRESSAGSASINISWKPNTVNYQNLTGYKVTWMTYAANQQMYCKCIPKNTTNITLDNSSGGWMYPETIGIVVSPVPTKDFETDFMELNPLDNCTYQESDNAPVLHKEPFPSDKVLTAVTATLGGLVIVAVLGSLYVYYKRPRILSPPEPRLVEEEKNDDAPRVYMMYFGQSESFINKVACITKWLLEHGIEAIMNKMHTQNIRRIGDAQWGRQQIEKAEKVIVVCNSGFLRLCQQHDSNRVNNNASPEEIRTLNEIGLLKIEQYNTAHTSRKFIPLKMGVSTHDLPSFLMEYRDQTYNWADCNDQERLLYLLREINEYQC